MGQCERITELVRELRINLKELLELKPECFIGGGISYGLLRAVVEDDLGWEMGFMDTNGWQIDYWIEITVPNESFIYKVEGCMYDDTITIKKHYNG